MRQLFIYWKTPVATADVAQAATAAMQRELRGTMPLLQARLFRRSEAPQAPQAPQEQVTLMEIYAMTGADLSQAAQDRIAQAALPLAAWCADGRHVEVFDEQAP
jgi:Domain of unknown function (DUF4936)